MCRLLKIAIKNILIHKIKNVKFKNMWNDADVTVDVVAPIGEPSSVSSDGSKSCPLMAAIVVSCAISLLSFPLLRLSRIRGE